jgi:hypothetical protein
MRCPNCGTVINKGYPCPECDHDDGDDYCTCETCASRPRKMLLFPMDDYDEYLELERGGLS